MTEADQSDSSAERNSRQLSDAPRMRADLQAMLDAPAGRDREWLFRSFVQDRQYVWFEPMARSFATRWHRTSADDIFEVVALIQAQAWELVQRSVEKGAIDAQPGGLLRTMVSRAVVKMWGQTASPLTHKQLAFLHFAKTTDGQPVTFDAAIVGAFNDARRAGAPQMTDKELVSKSRLITAIEVDDIRFLLDSGQISASGAIRVVTQQPDYRHTSMVDTHETTEFLLALLAELARTDMALYAAARIFVGGTPMAPGHDITNDQFDNSLGGDFQSADELAAALSISVPAAKSLITKIQKVARELVLRDGWDPNTDSRTEIPPTG